MVDYMQGKWPSSKDLPEQVTEFFFALSFGWSLEYIRKISVPDYEVFSKLLGVYYILRNREKQRSSL